MKLKTLMLAVGAAFGLTFAAGSAQALTVAQIIAANPNFQLEDDNAETQNIDLNGNTLLDVGDSLRGIVKFPQIRNLDDLSTVSLDGGVNSDLSAVFEVVVLTKVLNDDPATPFVEYDFTFGPSAAFAASLGLPAGTMIAFYEDDIDNVALGGATCTTAGAGGDCEANVLDGTLVLTLGFSAGETDELWQALQSPEDPTVGGGIPPSTAVGNFQFQLDVLSSSLGNFGLQPTPIPVLGGDGFIPWIGSGSVLGTQNVNTPYDVTSDSDLQASIPEPGTLGLMGVGLLALAGFARKRFRKAA